MDHFKQLQRQVLIRIYLALLGLVMILGGGIYVMYAIVGTELLSAVIVGSLLAVAYGSVIGLWISDVALGPVALIRQAVLHVDPDRHGTPAPNMESIGVGRNLVNNLILQIYQFASQQNSKELIDHRKEIVQASSVVSHLPLPLFVFNKDLLVINASVAGIEYVGIESAKLFGQPIFDSLNLEFSSEQTLEAWMKECQANKATDTANWERVRVRLSDGTLRQCDVAAFYNRDNPSGADFIVTLFDRTKQYTEDDDNLSFVALAVHELRTPLTMLRGYIEVFEEELMPSLSDELKNYMLKMQASANQLTSFVHNILNVARIDGNQLSLHLTEASWEKVLRSGIADMELRAKIMGKSIELNLQKNLPTAAVDQVSIYEVLNNLLDNALKYSPNAKKVVINSKLNNDGYIETTVQDFGVGIPESVLPNLFERFYRNHRTRAQIGGTGLGLYLSKALINAHGGQIWASSKAGEGSTFGFTIVPYAKLSAEQKAKTDGDIVREAHGWIKNHSYYRR